MLLADVVIVLWALGVFGRDAAPASVSGAGASTSTSSTSPSSSSSSPSTTTPTRARYVAAAVGETLWRATPGSCGGTASVVERSEDGGATWDRARYRGQVTYRLRLTGPGAGFAVGEQKGCDGPVVLTTADVGQTWQESPARTTWAAMADTVLVPGGKTVSACGSARVVGLAPLDDASAWVACADGSVRRSTDAGQTWDKAFTATGVTSIAVAGDRVVLGRSVDGCQGLQVGATGADAASAGTGTCVTGAQDATVVLGDQGGWLVGERTWRSTDLTAWEPVG